MLIRCLLVLLMLSSLGDVLQVLSILSAPLSFLMMACRLKLFPTLFSLSFLVKLFQPLNYNVRFHSPTAPSFSLLHRWPAPLLPTTWAPCPQRSPGPFPLPGSYCRQSYFPQLQPQRAPGVLLRVPSNVSTATQSQHEGWGRLDASCRCCRCVGLEVWHTVMAPLFRHSPSPVTWL